METEDRFQRFVEFIKRIYRKRHYGQRSLELDGSRKVNLEDTIAHERDEGFDEWKAANESNKEWTVIQLPYSAMDNPEMLIWARAKLSPEILQERQSGAIDWAEGFGKMQVVHELLWKAYRPSSNGFKPEDVPAEALEFIGQFNQLWKIKNR